MTEQARREFRNLSRYQQKQVARNLQNVLCANEENRTMLVVRVLEATDEQLRDSLSCVE